MKPEQIYQQLVDLAEKLDISVSEKNLKGTGIKVKSGLCRVRKKTLFVMDKHQSVREKIRLLARCLGEMPLDDIYVIPAVREEIQKHL